MAHMVWVHEAALVCEHYLQQPLVQRAQAQLGGGRVVDGPAVRTDGCQVPLNWAKRDVLKVGAELTGWRHATRPWSVIVPA